MTSRNRTYYEILGVSADASLKEIRDGYRQKAREFHPDLNPDPDAVERMQEINEAYEVLRDKEQRAAYDRAHRHFAATEGRLRQAKTEAIVIVGELAFHLGWDIGGGKGNEWAKASIGDENTPGALWAAVFEAVLESALDGGDTSSMQRAAREAAWTGAHNETARQARRHALYESASSVTEAISIDISITAVGVLASTMGRQIGETRTRVKPRAQAWQDVFKAAENASLEGLSRYRDMLAKGERLRDSTLATIASYAAEAGRAALSPYAERIGTETVEQTQDQRERLWEDAIRSAERKDRFRHALRRSLVVLLLLGVLALFGGGIAASLTGTTFDDIVDSVEQFWKGSSIDVPSSGPEQPITDGSDTIAPPIVPSPTATATVTPTPTPAPTAAPTPTPARISPWAGFVITSETLGKDITDRLSDEEIACLRSSNSDGYYEYLQSEPIGVRVDMVPPVRDVTDLPRLAGCLSEESTQHLNLAIAVFHDPSLATPTPEPTPIPKPTPGQSTTPKPPPTEKPAPPPTNTPTPTPLPELTRADRLRQLALDLINKDRADHGMPAVVLGTNQAAQLHAQDMLTNDYQGHMWADGRKPYMVYSQTRGTSYAAENAASSGWQNHEWNQAGCGSFLVRCIVPTPEEAIRDLQWLMMYDDAHANWGHRDNILDSTHRAVNIGIAWNSRRVVFVQHFEGGAVTADAPPSLRDGRILSLAATKNEVSIRIGGAISIYYDPPPAPVSRQLNDSLDSYCVGGGATTNCPDYLIRILDPPGPGRFYTNLNNNDVVATSWRETASSFSFSADVGSLMEKAGVYTIMLWRDEGGTRFSESLVQLSVFVD